MIDATPMAMPTVSVLSNVTGIYFYSVEEIRSLLNSAGIKMSPARLEALFRLIGKKITEPLTPTDFVKLMHSSGSTFYDRSGDSSNDATLNMMAASQAFSCAA